MVTLVSFLGKSQQSAKTGYRTAAYKFDDKTVETVPFFGMGLLRFTQPEKLILLGTAGSMWDVFFDQQAPEDENILELMDAVAQASVNEAMLEKNAQKLAEKLGMPVSCVLIPYAKTQEEQVAILQTLSEHLLPDERVMLDVTHGFRHLPMLALVAARYLTHVRGVCVEEIYYGALEMTDPQTNETPVLRLGGMSEMLTWVEALASYKSNGDYSALAAPLEADGMDARRAIMLAQAAYFEKTNNPSQAKQELTGALNHIQNHPGAIGGLFASTLTKDISWFRYGDRADWELSLGDKYLALKDYARSLNYYFESFVSFAVRQAYGDYNNYEDREAATKTAFVERNAKLLRNLRNATAHGVRTWDKDAKRLLQDPQKLEQQIRELRRSLFGAAPITA